MSTCLFNTRSKPWPLYSYRTATCQLLSRDVFETNVLIFCTHNRTPYDYIRSGFIKISTRVRENILSSIQWARPHIVAEYYSLFIRVVILLVNFFWFTRIVELLLSSLGYLKVVSINFDLWIKSGNRSWEKKEKIY